MTLIPNPTSAVNPSPDSVDALATWPDDDAIAMVNLLKYSRDTGREAYARYAAVATGTIMARGGSLIYLGSVVSPTGLWDTLAIVRYPRRSAFIDMQNDPAYRGAIPDRTAGLSARLLYPFSLPDDLDTGRVQTSVGGELVGLQLVSDSSAPAPQNGRTLLQLAAGGPGLVADDRWNEMRLISYESADSWEADPPSGGTEALCLLTQPAPTV